MLLRVSNRDTIAFHAMRLSLFAKYVDMDVEDMGLFGFSILLAMSRGGRHLSPTAQASYD
jgi:hypothetical protein